jgi:CheY-like chemotaxis protein
MLALLIPRRRKTASIPMAAQESRRPVILVVDDEPLIAQLVAETLAAEGYEVETASNGREALEKITLRSFDLVLCDLRMPELDGVGLYRALEKGHADLLQRIAFVTGTTEPPDYSRFLKETAVPVLHKPFNLGDLERFVRQLL